MSWIDWLVLFGTLGFIAGYGIYKTRGQKDLEGYIMGGRAMPWYAVMFSVMATQASAITFLSAPGQAYTDGMRFVQFYFGLPIAIIFICAFFLPRYFSLKIYTAYEYLETRFDLKTRMLTAFLFLVQRGLAAGITIYAPSLVISALLGWNIYLTNLIMGGFVVAYTMLGGSKAVAQTQMQQMLVILGGMFISGLIIVQLLPADVSFNDAISIGGVLGKLNPVSFEFNLNDKYNVWSGIIGGSFLALSYFGTDQSQVGRYLTAKSIKESRIGLLMNAAIKIPMQFAILFIGVLLIAFFQFKPTPLNFNNVVVSNMENSVNKTDWNNLNQQHDILNEKKNIFAHKFLNAESETDKSQAIIGLQNAQKTENELRTSSHDLIHKTDVLLEADDTNYIFLHFVLNYLPVGLIGLLIACIFAASWSSTSSEINALASTTIIDFYKRNIRQNEDQKHYVKASKIVTLCWGVLAIIVAEFATELGSLIEAVNVLGSLFYGTILGVFLCGFFTKKITGTAVFIGAILSEIMVLLVFYYIKDLGFLWLPVIGTLGVIIFAFILNEILRKHI